MRVFAIFQEGVYRHACGGIYSKEESARARADQLAEQDSDDYHVYEVVPFELDEPCLVEADVIHRAQKGK